MHTAATPATLTCATTTCHCHNTHTCWHNTCHCHCLNAQHCQVLLQCPPCRYAPVQRPPLQQPLPQHPHKQWGHSASACMQGVCEWGWAALGWRSYTQMEGMAGMQNRTARARGSRWQGPWRVHMHTKGRQWVVGSIHERRRSIDFIDNSCNS